MRPSTEAAMWRIAYRLRTNDRVVESEESLKSAINVYRDVFDRAIEGLKNADIVVEVGAEGEAGYKIGEEYTEGELDWGDTLFKVLPGVQEETPGETPKTYIYRISFREPLDKSDTFGPQTAENLNEAPTVIRTRSPISVGDRLSLKGATWKVSDVFHEFARETSYDEEFDFPGYGVSENFVEEANGPIVKLVRADATL